MAGLYIHIPFCASKCAYCDFYSKVPGRNAGSGRMSEYMSALAREMGHRRNFFPDGRLDTVYIGGGTPTLLSPEQLQSLLGKAAELWNCTDLKETTVEANPEDLTDGYIAGLAETGFNRLSIGVQSFDDGLLRLMNRRHSAGRARDAVRAAQKAGFGNITIDLIYGIPGMTRRQWERSLDEAVGLGVRHISAYHLTIEPGTAFGRMAATAAASHATQNSTRTNFVPVPEAESERQYETLRRKLSDAGFEHYEISNFACPGFRARHNSAYWSGEAYLGIGPSAHSYDGLHTRSWAVADIAQYVKRAGTDAVYESETLSGTDLFNEFVMTSLRRAEGVETEGMERRFGHDTAQSFMQQAESFLKNGKLIETEGRIFIPAESFLLSDQIICALFASDRAPARVSQNAMKINF